MEKNVLRDFDTFEEFPDKNLLVDRNSNAFYIKKQDKYFIARRNVDSLTFVDYNSKDVIRYENSYYDVINGECILNLTILESLNNSESYMLIDDDCEISYLPERLNIKGNSKYYFSLDDVKVLTNYDNDKKVYKVNTNRIF